MYYHVCEMVHKKKIPCCWVSTGCSQILTVDLQDLQVDLVLIRLVDMGFNWMFSYPHCRFTRHTGGSGFNQIGGHGFQLGVLVSSQYIYKTYMWIWF